MLYLDVPAVVLGGPVAVSAEVLLPVGLTGAVIPPVIFHVQLMLRGEVVATGLGDGVVGVDVGVGGGGVLPVGEEGVREGRGEGFRKGGGCPGLQHLPSLARGHSVGECLIGGRRARGNGPPPFLRIIRKGAGKGWVPHGWSRTVKGVSGGDESRGIGASSAAGRCRDNPGGREGAGRLGWRSGREGFFEGVKRDSVGREGRLTRAGASSG